jgi:hypothetical protein
LLLAWQVKDRVLDRAIPREAPRFEGNVNANLFTMLDPNTRI